MHIFFVTKRNSLLPFSVCSNDFSTRKLLIWNYPPPTHTHIHVRKSTGSNIPYFSSNVLAEVCTHYTHFYIFSTRACFSLDCDILSPVVNRTDYYLIKFIGYFMIYFINELQSLWWRYIYKKNQVMVYSTSCPPIKYRSLDTVFINIVCPKINTLLIKYIFEISALDSKCHRNYRSLYLTSASFVSNNYQIWKLCVN